MEEPWNLKKDDVRTADSLPTFIIFCEDEVCESTYFKYFETPLIKINLIEGQKSKVDNVLKAISYCLREKIMEAENGVPTLRKDDIQVWCVYDRDTEPIEAQAKLGDTSFNESIAMAKARGINVAWSNDAFELWILLHFDNMDPEDHHYLYRNAYYERLTAIFKSLPSPRQQLSKALVHATFHYKKDLKQRKNFRDIVRNEIVSNTGLAIERAKILEQYHMAMENSNHEKAPCTLVHHLVEALIKAGRKEV